MKEIISLIGEELRGGFCMWGLGYVENQLWGIYIFDEKIAEDIYIGWGGSVELEFGEVRRQSL